MSVTCIFFPVLPDVCMLAVLSFQINSELVDNYCSEIFATTYQLSSLTVSLHALYSASFLYLKD